MSSLKGKVSIVTGGSRGIGSAICYKLAELGSNVVVNYSGNQEKAEFVAKDISEKFDIQALALKFDVGSETEVEAAVAQIIEKFGRVDILVNNAGITSDGLFVRSKLSEWEKVMNTNLTGPYLCSRAVTKHMMKAKSGRIINMSSVIGETGNAGQASYAASKSALFGLTKSLAKELGSRGITVNCITPGFIQTDMTAVMKEEQISQMLEQIPLKKLGDAKDIASLVAYLSLDDSSYITGQVIGVNGGMNM